MKWQLAVAGNHQDAARGEAVSNMHDNLELPDALTVSDWLLNVIDAISKRGNKVLEESPSSVEMPVFFNLANSLLSTNNTLHLAPKGIAVLGDILLEYRLYYDCFFQLQLIHLFSSHEEWERISRIYAFVAFRTKIYLKEIIAASPTLGSLLRNAIDGYDDHCVEATNLYIRGRHPKAVRKLLKTHGISEPSLANALVLAGRLEKTLGVDSASVEFEQLLNQVLEETKKCYLMKYFTQFDFENCDFPTFPESFYKSSSD